MWDGIEAHARYQIEKVMMMVKVLIYSSKEIYDNASYEGRAEAHIVAYKKDDGYYEVVKNRSDHYMGMYTSYDSLKTVIRWIENDEWKRELRNLKLKDRYVDHPVIELTKNAGIV